MSREIDLTAEGDCELMQLVSRGNMSAFQVIYDRYARSATGYFYGLGSCAQKLCHITSANCFYRHDKLAF